MKKLIDQLFKKSIEAEEHEFSSLSAYLEDVIELLDQIIAKK